MAIRKSTSDIVKFMCAIIILMGHIGGELDSYGIFVLIRRTGPVAMFAFLFLSGYGLAKSYYANGLEQFWEKKCLKVYIPAVCVNMFEALELLALNKIEYNRKVIFTEVFLLNSTQTTINSFLWFLHLLFIWYVMFFVVYNYVQKKNARMFIMGGISIIMWYITPQIWGYANLYLLAFPVGVIYAELFKDKNISQKIYGVGMMIGILAVGAWILQYQPYDACVLFGKHINFYVYTLFTNVVYGWGALSLIFIVDKLVGKYSLLQKKASTLGGMSLMIYYLQSSLVINLMVAATGVKQKVCVMFLGVAFLLLVSYVYSRCIGKKRGAGVA